MTIPATSAKSFRPSALPFTASRRRSSSVRRSFLPQSRALRTLAATDAFWSDVLTSAYHGYTDGYATVNGSFGVKWQGGTVTTTVKVTNLFNQTVQQHIFGDLLRRTVVGEMKFRF